MYDKTGFHLGLIFTIEDPLANLANINLWGNFLDLQCIKPNTGASFEPFFDKVI